MARTFKSNDMEISDILKDIAQGNNQLPDFQRSWVWDDERIRALIASIANSYPVGALMFLEYGGDIRFKYRPFAGATADNKPEILTLDGQQRLTSIFSAMFCRNAVTTRTDRSNKEIKRFYYMDIAKSLNNDTERLESILSIPETKITTKNIGREIELDLSDQEKEFTKHMFPLNIVYDSIAVANWRNAYQKFHNYDPTIIAQFDTFDTEVLSAIKGYKVPVITLSKDTPKEAVCQVFEHVNKGGVSLTVFELVTASFAADDFPLRDKWDALYDEFTERAEILSSVSATDFLTAITLLSRYHNHKAGVGAVSCQRKDVLALTLSDYKKYEADLARGFIESSNFLREQRIFKARDLPYTTQFIPLSVIYAVLGDKAQNSTVKKKLARWFWCGIFGEMYGGSNETRYVYDVTGVVDWVNGGNEPDTVSRAIFHPSRLLTMQTRLSAAYKGVMALILKSGAVDLISGVPMDFANFTEQAVDIHHIFPQAYCKGKFNKERWNSIVNKTPLSAKTNRIFSGGAPSRYLKRIENDERVTTEDLDKFVATHLINVDALRTDNFDEYFVNRAKAILELISTAMEKPIPDLNDEAVISAFGGSLK